MPIITTIEEQRKAGNAARKAGGWNKLVEKQNERNRAAAEKLIPPFPPIEEVKKMREEFGTHTTMERLRKQQLVGMIENFEKTGNRWLLSQILLRLAGADK